MDNSSIHPELQWQQGVGVDVDRRKGVDLHLWLVDDSRWETIDDEIGSGSPVELGVEATDELVPFGEQPTDFQYDSIGTFLFTTRDGGRGVLQSFPLDKGSGLLRLRYRLWGDEGGDRVVEESPPAPRDPDNWEPVRTITLLSPGPDRKFLLDLDSGETIAPPADVLPPYTNERPPLFRSHEQFAEWCRQRGIDVGTVQMGVAYSADPEPGMPNRIIQLMGLDMGELRVSPQAFETMSLDAVLDLLGRYSPEFAGKYAGLPPRSAEIDERPRYAHMTPPLDPNSKDTATFLITTTAGRIGFIQILQSADDLSSITFRYQLAKKSATAE
jgi:hypothetical protein